MNKTKEPQGELLDSAETDATGEPVTEGAAPSSPEIPQEIRDKFATVSDRESFEALLKTFPANDGDSEHFSLPGDSIVYSISAALEQIDNPNPYYGGPEVVQTAAAAVREISKYANAEKEVNVDAQFATVSDSGSFDPLLKTFPANDGDSEHFSLPGDSIAYSISAALEQIDNPNPYYGGPEVIAETAARIRNQR